MFPPAPWTMNSGALSPVALIVTSDWCGAGFGATTARPVRRGGRRRMATPVDVGTIVALDADAAAASSASRSGRDLEHAGRQPGDRRRVEDRGQLEPDAELLVDPATSAGWRSASGRRCRRSRRRRRRRGRRAGRPRCCGSCRSPWPTPADRVRRRRPWSRRRSAPGAMKRDEVVEVDARRDEAGPSGRQDPLEHLGALGGSDPVLLGEGDQRGDPSRRRRRRRRPLAAPGAASAGGPSIGRSVRPVDLQRHPPGVVGDGEVDAQQVDRRRRVTTGPDPRRRRQPVVAGDRVVRRRARTATPRARPAARRTPWRRRRAPGGPTRHRARPRYCSGRRIRPATSSRRARPRRPAHQCGPSSSWARGPGQRVGVDGARPIGPAARRAARRRPTPRSGPRCAAARLRHRRRSPAGPSGRRGRT